MKTHALFLRATCSETNSFVLTTLRCDSFLLLGADNLDIVLVEGCNGAEALAGANVADSSAAAVALVELVADQVFVVH